MTHRIGTKGQVVIPKELRDQVGLHPGAEVDFERDGDRIAITTRQSGWTLRGMFPDRSACSVVFVRGSSSISRDRR
jgi:AbrB family looped-hinge helix DNA binding protein